MREKADLTKLFWNDSMRSMWPSETLFKVVPKGSYSLTFVINTGGRNLKSNGVAVSIN